MATQEEMRLRWEQIHRRDSGVLPAKAAAMPETKSADPSFLSPELAAQVADVTRGRHVFRERCCEEAEAAGESWNRLCKKHAGSPAQRAEDRRWERHAAAVVAAQQLGKASDHVLVVDQDTATQRDSRLGKAPVVDRVPLELL